MNKIKYLLFISIFSVILFAAEKQYSEKEEITINSNNEPRPVLINTESSILPQSREEIDLWTDDFETEGSWSTDAGWQWTDTDSNSPTHSMNSPNDATTLNASWDLLSPVLTLPALGDGEVMHFGFFLNVDMPDSDGDGDNFLEDYYSVSLMDTDALAWHASATDSYDGNSWWCADESVGSNGGYLDSWLQFLDTPSFTVPSLATLSADMMWTIESDAGAVVAGTCTDGWDAANVRISTDGGDSWELLNGSDPYDFDCGYGWLWNDTEYDTGGSLNHLAAGWGNNQVWQNVTFSLSAYSGQEVIIRFAFGSDPAYSTLDDGGITGFHVDNVVVSSDALACDPEGGCAVEVSGAVWVDQFYDYYDAVNGQPGSNGWEEYLPGYPFNGNVFLDISDFAEKNVVFRIQSRYDADDDGGSGAGLFVDDFRVYKISGGGYPAPTGLVGESGDEEALLTWNDMNASGTTDFDYTNTDPNTGIQMSTSGSTAWAGERIDLAGPSTINTLSVHLGPNVAGVGTTIAVFGQLGSLYNNEPVWTSDVTLNSGWNDFDVNLDMNNSYIVAMQFTNVDDTPGGVYAPLDESAIPSSNSMVLFAGGSWDLWSVAGATVGDGEWGVKANISYSGAGVTYNVYQDGVVVNTGLNTNSATATGLTNNVNYSFAVSATYSDGEEGGQSESVEVTPQAQTVHEEYHDDGTAEEGFNAGSGNFTAVKYSAISEGESVVRFKWYQQGDGGAFYLKMYNDDNGMPGDESYSQVIAGGLVDGWNTTDLSIVVPTLVVSGDFWIGAKEFSSSAPFGLDTDSDAGVSYTRVGSTGDWTAVPGNLMMRVYLDCGENCEGGGTECTAGDVNADGIINVLDIVFTVGFVMNTQTPTDDQACAADYNGDGIINVLDIVSIVGIIIGG